MVKKDYTLGKSIIRSRFKNNSRPKEHDTCLHTTEMNDGPSWIKHQSITEQKDLDDFLATAELAGTEFTAERTNAQVVSVDFQKNYSIDAEEENNLKEKFKKNLDRLRIPRRPQWNREMTADQISRNENDSFLVWRRHMAELQEQEKLTLTPFEKNVEVWRQLWRVVEKSQILVQIVDARNPLLFYCSDLITYVNEVDETKKNILLVNKADLLTEEQRAAWADYFMQNNMEYIFYSAAMANEIDEEQSNEEDEGSDEIDSDANEIESESSEIESESNEIENETNEIESIDINSDAQVQSPLLSSETKFDTEQKTEDPKTKIYGRDELLGFLKSETIHYQTNYKAVTIGLVGYPNVGKSSTINSLLKAKKVAVGSTPGKTKHFQTLWLDESLCLCDCPGLVFPNFAFTKAELVVNGVLPIDQMRECIGPSRLVAERIPRNILERIYGIRMPAPAEGEDPHRPPTAYELLAAYAKMRGFMRSFQGNPDESRASRYILKDFVNGKLIYCHPPPDMDPKQFNANNVFDIKQKNLAMTFEPIIDSSFDSAFFDVQTVNAKTNGKFRSGDFVRTTFPFEKGAAAAPNSKKHFKKDKRRK